MTKIDNRELIAEAMDDSNFWNVHDELKGLPLAEIQAVQEKYTLPYAVCALNLTGDLNVGMMARTACLHGAREFIIFGRRKYDKRSTVGAQNYMPITRVDGFEDGTNDFSAAKFDALMTEKEYYPIAIEQGGHPIDLMNMGDWTDLIGCEALDPPYPCLVFGNENEGIPQDILDECAITLTLTQRGVLRSLNVSAAAAIAINRFSEEVMKLTYFHKDMIARRKNAD